ncbi:hypothetical protein COO59_19105 [Mixta theicola]|uniref:DUF3829 domain-containing protein n=1 Tax=Mixta theicola TaxID=1458355 RepID=A0A2K1Q4Y1_9GAMM|nr:DUF3829 domain-containing protein [Mixta theicola]PNS10098.1 hypothetical protein COO59_19105 [Mixta theicola]GLR08551.1 hypothetical protein GCM10007905_12700 [Mixta theicola]
MANNPWRLLITATLALFITACDQPVNNVKNTAATSAQTQINDKYAAFIKAANSESSVNFYSLPEAFYHYQRETEPQLTANVALTSYVVMNPVIFRTINEWLAKGLSLPGALPQLDSAAQAYQASIDKLLPLSDKLYAYRQSKGWLKDKGELARRSNAEYVAAFTTLLAKRDSFLKAIYAANSERIKIAYENSPADSAEHYRNGLVYLSRQTLHELSEDRTPAEDMTLKHNVATLKELSLGWRKLIQQQNNQDCEIIINAANDYISVLHEAINQQTQGEEVDKEDIILPFNALVQALNSYRSC